jgi:hypothetical protein
MKASVGEHLVVHRRNEGQPDRDGEIVEVRGESGEPPYLVRWADDGHESLVYPGPGATVTTGKGGSKGGQSS